ncbi:hypothetical protein ACGFNU_17820 [Spirillospora sp. NPDC048911]|uniref:hypothetical protein n=1 Tax=Spirillospora sp. NPDC048911 TaxID=3364527 RepID=UPI003716D399
MTGYNVERNILRKHVAKLDEYHDAWKSTVQDKILSGGSEVKEEAFTAFGGDFVSAYNALVTDYLTYIAGVKQALVQGSAALEFVARTYGLAEAEVARRMKEVQTPRSPGSGGIEKLLP